jgi:hypothetical protein
MIFSANPNQIKLKGESNAVDNFCNTGNPVAAGIGEQLHDGGFHPYPAGDCRYRSTGQYHSRPENHIAGRIS